MPVAVAGTGVRHWLIIVCLMVACGFLGMENLFREVLLSHNAACIAGASEGGEDLRIAEQAQTCIAAAPTSLSLVVALAMVNEKVLNLLEGGMERAAYCWEHRERLLASVALSVNEVVNNPDALSQALVARAEAGFEWVRGVAGGLGVVI